MRQCGSHLDCRRAAMATGRAAKRREPLAPQPQVRRLLSGLSHGTLRPEPDRKNFIHCRFRWLRVAILLKVVLNNN